MFIFKAKPEITNSGIFILIKAYIKNILISCQQSVEVDNRMISENLHGLLIIRCDVNPIK